MYKINGAQDDRPYQMYTYMQNSHCAYTLCDECDCIMIIFWIVANAIAIQLGGYGMIWFSCFVELHYDWVQNSKFSIHHHMIRLCLLLSNTLSDTIGVGMRRCVCVCLCHPWMVLCMSNEKWLVDEMLKQKTTHKSKRKTRSRFPQRNNKFSSNFENERTIDVNEYVCKRVRACNRKRINDIKTMLFPNEFAIQKVDVVAWK